MPIKHLVFDWDGTLADTYPVISAAYNHVYKILNLPPIPYDEIKHITSTIPNKNTLDYLFGNRQAEAKQAYYDYIRKHHTDKLAPIDGAAEFLEYAKNHQYLSYLITNKTRPYLLEETKTLGFDKYFSSIVAAGDCPEDKPHPIAAYTVFNGILPPADSILVIGDGIADYSVARTYDHDNKQAHCAIIDPQNKYLGPKPDYLLPGLKNLIPVLEENS